MFYDQSAVKSLNGVSAAFTLDSTSMNKHFYYLRVDKGHITIFSFAVKSADFQSCYWKIGSKLINCNI